MARISVAQGMEWTETLSAILRSAGHDVTGEQREIAFVAAGESQQSSDTPTIIVAALDRLQQAIEAVKTGAYAFVRYPFVADEVTLLVERAIDHHNLSREHQHRHPRIDSPAPGNGDVSAARNLAGKPLADIEKQVILSTLEQFKGHRVKTATALGIGVRTLGMKLKKWRDEGEPIIGRSHRAMQTQ